MATKKVNLKISLQDGVSAGLKKIGTGVKTLGVGFKNVAKIGVASFAALGAGIALLGKAFAEQETVNNKMAAAFDAVGESGSAAVEKWGAFATAIQRTTTLGDEEIMNLVTLGKVMGVTNDKLEEATKGAIGLSKAFGIDMTASMKMVALAQQGEFEMLARYIPALRQATTEAEKQTIVNKAMANGFKIAEAELDTLSGQFKALKGVVGDAMQEAGKAVGEGGFTSIIEDLKNSIIRLTEDGTITAWAEKVAQGFRSVIAQAKQAAETIRMMKMRADIKSEVKEAVFEGRTGGGIGGAIQKHKLNTKETRDKIEETTTRIMKKRLEAERKARLAIADEEAVVRKEAIAKERSDAKRAVFLAAKASADLKKGYEVSDAGVIASAQVDALKDELEKSAPEIAEIVGGSVVKGATVSKAPTATTGFAEMSARMSGSGLSGIDLTRRNSSIARAEAMGRESGVAGLGGIAGDLASEGLSGIDLSRAITDALSAELAGRESAEVNMGAEAVRTNELLVVQNNIMEERLGGVIG